MRLRPKCPKCGDTYDGDECPHCELAEGDAVKPDGLVIAAYGGGVNTVAMLITLRDLGIVPKAIVMGDPGAERRKTIEYRDGPMREWLTAQSFPSVVVVERRVEGLMRKGFINAETLAGLCERTSSLPSIAYGSKKCSLNYKAAPSRWWVERQPWARAEWAAGRRIVKAIGYDADEKRRVRDRFNDELENKQYVPWYPLVERDVDREECEAIILAEGLPLPGKSACKWCPNNTIEEWEALKIEDPAGFAEAVDMSERAEATIESPDVVGLMRCNPHGKRQLHIWADGGYAGERLGVRDEAMPCECAL